ncbi:hypothetical protein ACFCP7_25210 [Paenibacillus elgii]
MATIQGVADARETFNRTDRCCGRRHDIGVSNMAMPTFPRHFSEAFFSDMASQLFAGGIPIFREKRFPSSLHFYGNLGLDPGEVLKWAFKSRLLKVIVVDLLQIIFTGK